MRPLARSVVRSESQNVPRAPRVPSSAVKRSSTIVTVSPSVIVNCSRSRTRPRESIAMFVRGASTPIESLPSLH